ncbi:MAG: triose-phosphate isomerase [Pseudohongiella sp.]|nr:triose-phosphate isomerase [Pseudohongiella sp.]MDO9521951.1 triose-phosphate isomerase [Pseudohongiella sp.]
MRRALIAANWKMHGSRDFIRELVGQLLPSLSNGVNGVDLVLCPPFPYLAQVAELSRGAELILGAQNICSEHEGAFTGEISGRMLADFKVRYVIVGHSERRKLMAENDALVARKFVAAQASGLIPVLCVGETLDERNSGNAAQVVEQQLSAVLEGSGVEALRSAVIAYEPVWAIGTGCSASTSQAQDMHASIRRMIAEHDPEVAQSVQIVYGGSVTPDNAPDLFSQPDIDGGLIGGASLNAESFIRICQSVS